MLEKMFGVKCPRCGKRNPTEAEYCGHCKVAMRRGSPVILKNNRWEAAEHEFAAFFATRDLEGVFSKTVYIPAGMRACILQNNRVVQVPEGEYTVEDMFARLNGFFGEGNHGEILITRQAALPVPIHFERICSAEFLEMEVDLSLLLQIVRPIDFRNHFMLRAGAVGIEDLARVLKASVKVVLAEFAATHSATDILNPAWLRPHLNKLVQDHLLQQVWSRFGLACSGLAAIEIYHPEMTRLQQKKSQQWLSEQEDKLEQQKQHISDSRHTEQQWAPIKAREEELKRQAKVGELDEKEADMAYAARVQSVERLARLLKLESREAAERAGLQNDIEQIEAEYAHKRHKRESEKMEWEAVREQAQIRYETEHKVLLLKREESLKLAQNKADNELQKQQILAQIELANLIEDDKERRQYQQQQKALLDKVRQREEALLDEQNRLAVEEVRLQRQLRAAEAAWKITRGENDIQREQENNDLAQLKKLLELDDWDERQSAEREEKKQDRLLEREIKRHEMERADRESDREHEIRKMTVMGSLPVEAQISMADKPQIIDTLGDIGKLAWYAQMSEGQIRAARTTTPAYSEFSATGILNAESMARDVSSELSKADNHHMAQSDKHIEDLKAVHQQTIDALRGMAQDMKEVAIGTASAYAARQEYIPPRMPEQQAFGSNIGKKCPRCYTLNSAVANYCKVCGKSLGIHVEG